jgi:hypothetical protein
MKPYDTVSITRHTQANRGTCIADVPYIGPICQDDGAQLDVGIIHQMVVDALRAVAVSSAETLAGRQLVVQRLVP